MEKCRALKADFKPQEPNRWKASVDKFAAAVLICEMLTARYSLVLSRQAGDAFFMPDECSGDTGERYMIMYDHLEKIGKPLAELFRKAWLAPESEQCPSLAQWRSTLSDVRKQSEFASETVLDRRNQMRVTLPGYDGIDSIIEDISRYQLFLPAATVPISTGLPSAIQTSAGYTPQSTPLPVSGVGERAIESLASVQPEIGGRGNVGIARPLLAGAAVILLLVFFVFLLSVTPK